MSGRDRSATLLAHSAGSTQSLVDEKVSGAKAGRSMRSRRRSIHYEPSYKQNPPHLDGVGDMSKLIHLEEDNVVYNLQCRYNHDDYPRIYTSMASVLIAVNPYESLPIYTPESMAQYRGQNRGKLGQLPPHCFAVAEEASQMLAKTGANQAMVICGESGSGKTETAKVFMRYLASHHDGATSDGKTSSIEEQFLQANPVLESFGNAQTVMNNNSSRFGKFTKVLFETKENSRSAGRIVGSTVETYLLEKSRVVHQGRGERNYHVFYQIFNGLSAETKTKFGLTEMDAFNYISQSGVYTINGVSDEERFNELSQALDSLGVTATEKNDMFQCLAAILHLGNIEFDDTADQDQATVHLESEDSLKYAAAMLGVDVEELRKRLTTTTMKVGMQNITKYMKFDDAVYNRDAISKTVYSQLFNWVVRRINSVLCNEHPDQFKYIGILDVFGFESSDQNNSFEQLCINFANERLQNYFNEHIIKSEQDEYMREALPWTPITVPDNTDMIDLIEGKPNGIIAQLDSACVMPNGTDVIFLDNLLQAHPRHARLSRSHARRVRRKSLVAVKFNINLSSGGSTSVNDSAAKGRAVGGSTRQRFEGFSLRHYAGQVTYNVTGFLDKNNDNVHPDTEKLLATSGVAVVTELVVKPDAKDGARPKRRKAFSSVGTFFSKQLASLMKTLTASTPHFVRCVNPNQFKQPRTFDDDYVRPQLRCGGLVEALRILKLGFPSRVAYDEIYNRYGATLPDFIRAKIQDGDGSSSNAQKADFAEALFMAFGMDTKDYQLGLTKVFFRPGKQEFLENILGQNDTLSQDIIDKIRSLMVRKRIARMRAGILLLVRLQLWVNKKRAKDRLLANAAKVVFIAESLATPLRAVFERRAVRTLQAYMHQTVAQRTAAAKSNATGELQRFLRAAARRQALKRVLDARTVARREKFSGAALSVQSFWRSAVLRRGLTAELDKRVTATKERLLRQAQLEAAKRDAEEKERLRLLEEERRRVEERLASERKAKEEAEAAAEAERQRIEAERVKHEEEERLEREREEEELRKKREEEEAARKARELERRQQREAEEAERKAKEEEAARRKAEAQKREEEWRARIEAERKAKEDEENARLLAVNQEAEAKAEAERVHKERELMEKRRIEAQKRIDELAKEAEEQLSLIENTTLPDHVKQKSLARHSELVREQYNLAFEALSDEEKATEASLLRAVLMEGDKFLKYGKHGKPHIKYVCLNVLGALHWDDDVMDPRRLRPSSTYIHVKDVQKVYIGKHTPVFTRTVAEKADDNVCFSIVTADRSLDLQCVTIEQRDLWVRAIESAIRDVQDQGMVNMITGEKSATPPPKPTKREQPIPEVKSAAVHEPVQSPPPQKEAMLNFLELGGKLTKFNRNGSPKDRWFNCVQEILFWGDMPSPSQDPSSSFIQLVDVQEVRLGKNTKVMKKRYASSVQDELCFSLILPTRTLDLKASNKFRRDNWVEALKLVIQQAKSEHDEWMAGVRERQDTYASGTLRSSDVPVDYYATARTLRGMTVTSRGSAFGDDGRGRSATLDTRSTDRPSRPGFSEMEEFMRSLQDKGSGFSTTASGANEV
jgi:myosin heavy subunit